ncbi:hypothetical protein ACROYT_G025424 [Oculina patagonica]
MKDKITGSSKKRSSTTDVRPSGRRPSNATNVTNPFLLPEFDEEHFDPSTESAAPSVNEVTKTAPTIWQKQFGGGVSFKKVAKAITKQRKWSTVLKEVRQSDDHTRARGFVAKSEDGEGRLSFNVNAFKPHVQSCGFLSACVKKTLRTLSWNRTDEEIEVVLQVVKKLKCFDRYPMYVKRELAKVLYYDMFEKGRVVIKQGHVGISFYFIVSGSVIVERMEEDKHTGEQHKQVVGEMSEGDAFGELALLHNIRRTATIICKENSEFLRVDKPDFDEVILGDIDGPADDVFFIQSGKCKVVREIAMIRNESSTGKIRLKLPPINFTEPTDNGDSKERIVKKFLTVHVLNKGDFFGVGEDLKKTYIITVGRSIRAKHTDTVHCVLISQLIFMKKERGKALEALKQKLSEAFLTQKQAFKCYIEDRNWKIYKKKLIDDIITRRRRPHRTSFDDVPVVVRVDNSHYFEP